MTTNSRPGPSSDHAAGDHAAGDLPAGRELAGLSGRVFDAVLFDLDGTLIDSTASVTRSWSRWAGQRRLGRGSFEVVHGVPARQTLASFLAADQLEAAADEIETLEIADAEGIPLLPGVSDALAALPPGRSAIATSCTDQLARARIKGSGLLAPAVVVSASDVAVGKPDPAPYLLAASRLGMDPARCLVVEDAPAGLRSARAAGCATLALTTTHPGTALEADAVVGTLADVTFTADGAGIRVRARSANRHVGSTGRDGPWKDGAVEGRPGTGPRPVGSAP